MSTTWVDLEQWYRELLGMPTPEIKLTNGQLDELKRNTNHAHLATPSLMDIRIVLVDTVEESTPHQLAAERLAREAAYRQEINANLISRWTIR